MRIGLIAISGVRALNPELTRLGLTLPGFVERNKTIASLPSLGLLTLAGLVPPDIEVEYVEVPNPDQLEKLPVDFDLVAISSFSAQIKEAYRLADRFRREGIHVAMGGLHVTARPDEALQHADSVVLGEGELGWPVLLADFRAGRVQPMYDFRGHDFDLAQAPLPRFDLLNPERYNRLTVQTQRGCPFNCEFCAASVRLSPRYKVKPVEKIVDEIRAIKAIWPKPFIEFADDNTFAHRKHGRRLVEAMMDLDVKWFTETDVSVAQDEDLIKRMRDSGCVQILIGFESPTRGSLEGLEQESNWKAHQYDRYRKAITTIQSNGISVNGCFVMGLDGSDESSFAAVLDFARDSGLHEVQATIMTPFPETPLYIRLKTEGRLLVEDAWDRCTLFDVNYVPRHMSVADLEAGFRWLVENLYSEESVRFRRSRFRAQRREAKTQITEEAS